MSNYLRDNIKLIYLDLNHLLNANSDTTTIFNSKVLN